MKQIPNIFTLLNLVFGCMAIVMILQNGIVIHYDVDGAQFVSIPEKIWLASLFIGLAAVVDFLDGFVARLFNASSEMGKQLDSLADVVTFGVAPSMIFYQFLRMSYASEEGGIETAVFYLLPAFLVAAAAAYRLARFNIDTSSHTGFTGVPTPAVGLLVASFPLIYWNNSNEIAGLLLNKYVLYSMILVLSWLMISNLPLMSLKIKNRSLKSNMGQLLLIGLGILFAILFHWLAVPILFITYIILSLVFKNKA